MKDKIGIVLSDFKYFLITLLSKIIIILPHDKNIILFESNSDFCDNPKALFDCMLKNKLEQKYKIVWILKENKNIEMLKNKYSNIKFIKYSNAKLTKDFFRIIYYDSIAKYTFYSHSFIGMPSNKKQTRFFMTHAAVPIKNTKNKFWNYKRNTYILSTSEFSAFYRCLTFNGGIERVKILGFPRNDQLFNEDNSVKTKLGLNNYEKLIIWMPTFKHHKSSNRNDFKSTSKEDISLLTKENMIRIDNELKKYNIGMIIKFHPAQNMDFVQNINLENIHTISNQQLLENDIDLYTLIGQTDGLITDFSSIYFDYLLVNKPIAFELGDKTKYESGVGFIVDKPLEYMPGNKIYNIDDFITFVKDINDNNDKYEIERNKLKEKVHNHFDNNSAQRIIDFLKL